MRDIRVVGMGLRAPKSPNVHAFLDNLDQHVDMTTESRRYPENYMGLPPRTGTLEPQGFDSTFFGYNAKQADSLDHGIRILLHTTYEALLDAGISKESLDGDSRTGVFIGHCFSDMYQYNSSFFNEKTGNEIVNEAHCMAANKISFFFNLKGPSMTIDTACSSSLVAMDMAVKAIKEGTIDRAIVGGISMTLNPSVNKSFHAFSMLSPDGRCYSFDDRANGYCRSEAVATIIISSSPTDRNYYCRVAGSGSNNNGHMKEGITFPSGEAQFRLADQVAFSNNIQTRRVRFVEAHGTGTTAGDKQELEGLLRFYGAHSKGLRIGSVKSNMGHAEGASGIMSVCKALLMMRTDKIYANHDFQVSSHEPIKDGIFRVLKETEDYEFKKGDLIHVNNFGFGGSNAVVFLEKMDMISKYAAPTVPYSITNHPDLTDRQDASTIVANMMHGGLRYINGQKITRPVDVDRGLAIVFPGQGSQYEQMCKELYTSILIYRETIERLDSLLATETDGNAPSLVLLYEHGGEWMQARYSTLGIVSSQVAIANIMQENGISEPQYVIGHSIGEIAACYMSGAIDERTAIVLAYNRSKCVSMINDLKNGYIGSMIAVGLTVADVEQEINTLGLVETRIACYNATSGQTVSGPKTEVDILFNTLKARGVFVAQINTDGVAYHSKILDRSRDKIAEALYMKHSTSKELPDNLLPTSLKHYHPDVMIDLEFHCNNIASPVYFCHRIDELPSGTLVMEIGPSAILTSQMKRSRTDLHYCTLVEKGKPEQNLKRLSDLGLYVALEGHVPLGQDMTLYQTPDSMIGYENVLDSRQHFFIPTYRDYEFADKTGAKKVQFNLDTEWSSMRDHVVGGHNLFPAMGYVYAIWKVYENADLKISGLKIREGLVIERTAKKIELEVRLEHDGNVAVCFDGKVKVTATVHKVETEIKVPNCEESTGMTRAQFYSWIRRVGYAYRNMYMALDNIKPSDASIRTDVDWVSYFDSCLHLLLYTRETMAFPTGIDEVVLVKAGAKSGRVFRIDDVSVCTENIRISGVAMTPSLYNYSTTAVTRKQVFVPYFSDESIDPAEFHEVVRFCGGCVCLNGLTAKELWPNASELFSSDGKVFVTDMTDELYSRPPGTFTILVTDKQPPPSGWIVRSGRYALYGAKFTDVVFTSSYQDIRPDGRTYCITGAGAATSFVKTLSKEGYPAVVFSNQNTGMFVNDIQDDQVGLWVEMVNTSSPVEPGVSVHGSVRRPGMVESFEWIQSSTKSHTVTHAALNFRDVMRAYGQLKENDMRIGFEFSGFDNADGQRVCGVTTNGIANHCNPVYTFDIPADVTDAEAATIPVVYLTAYYALFGKAHVQPGDAVLIHAGSGGVGIAAINICQKRGIEVFTTCQTSKRQWIKDVFGLDDAHIGDSRSDAFVQTVLDGTAGRGVKCVVNSLSGDLLLAGLKCVMSGGSFCEIGKYDVMNGSAISLAILERNLSFHVIDLMPLLSDKRMHALWDEYLTAGFMSGEIKPLPMTLYPPEQTVQALRDMSQGKHRGKILIDFTKPVTGSVRMFKTFEVSGETHMITGGLGGFALCLADRLSMRGARAVVLIGRSNTPLGRWQQDMIDRIQTRGTMVVIHTSGIDHLPYDIDVDTVWHAATVYRDQMFTVMNPADWSEMLKVKPGGALAIRAMYPCAKIINVSSIVSYLGNPGQTNYAWANGALDDLGRNNIGCTTIQLGAVDNVGFVAQRDENLRILENADSLALVRVQEILDFCEEVYEEPNGVFSYYAKKVAETHAVADLSAWTMEDSCKMLQHIIGTSADTLKDMVDAPIDTLGMDSLSRVELINTIKQMGGPAIPPPTVGAMSIRVLTDKIKQK